MITPRKLMGLPFRNRMRTVERALTNFVRRSSANTEFERLQLHHLLTAVSKDPGLSPDLARDLGSVADILVGGDLPVILREANAARHAIRAELGIETADWDLIEPSTGAATVERVLLAHRIYLEDVRSPYNVGAIFRAAESFGVSEVLLSPGSASPHHRRAIRAGMGTVELVPWRRATLENLDQSLKPDERVFLLETGGTELDQFEFPTAGIMVIGSEELGASTAAREKAADSAGIVSIRTGGLKGSLNVSVAVGITLHRWFAVQQRS